MKDQYGRTIDYMRVSITDRCNLRCRYCMPEGIELVSMEEILTYEEIERICRIAAETGIRKTENHRGRTACPSRMCGIDRTVKRNSEKSSR